jgi:hypothetical protein
MEIGKGKIRNWKHCDGWFGLTGSTKLAEKRIENFDFPISISRFHFRGQI